MFARWPFQGENSACQPVSSGGHSTMEKNIVDSYCQYQCQFMIYFAAGHAVDDALYDDGLHKVLGRVNHDPPVSELRIVDDDGAVDDDEGVQDVVVLDELEERLEAVPSAKVCDCVDAGVQLPVVEPNLHLVGLVRVPRY